MTVVATIYRSIRSTVKLFCIGDRNDKYKRNLDLGMVATKVTLVKSSVMEVSNDGCDWSISFVIGKSGTRLQYNGLPMGHIQISIASNLAMIKAQNA